MTIEVVKSIFDNYKPLSVPELTKMIQINKALSNMYQSSDIVEIEDDDDNDSIISDFTGMSDDEMDELGEETKAEIEKVRAKLRVITMAKEEIMKKKWLELTQGVTSSEGLTDELEDQEGAKDEKDVQVEQADQNDQNEQDDQAKKEE